MKKILETLTQARTNLLLDHPFFGTLAMRLKTEITENVQTFATDGKRLLVNPKFAASLSTAETMGVLAHEVLHCAGGHCWRRGERDPQGWNVACDGAINPIVIDAGLTLPAGCVFDPSWKGLAAEEIYGKLPPEQRSGGSQGNGNGCGEVLDGEGEDQSEQEAEWKVATIQAANSAKAQGKLSAALSRFADESTRAKMDWKALLRRFVQATAKADYTWKRPSPRYVAHGLYLPSVQSESMPPIVVAVDTSGSIGDAELSAFVGEIKAIVADLRPEKTVVLYADADVCGVEEFEPDDEIVIKPKGGGGTDFRPVFDWIKDSGVACLVYLTDLYGVFPEEESEIPTLWISTTKKVAPFGETVRMELEVGGGR